MSSAPKPVTRRRAHTRQRLLDAAREVFAREGFGRSTVEQVCEAAGFTRGAFYSNFTSLDELFLEMWAQESAAMLSRLQDVAAVDAPKVSDVRSAVKRVLEALPVDTEWFQITAEFTAHAVRTPGLAQVMARREEAIQEALFPVIDRLLEQIGRKVTNRVALGRSLVAAYDGTLTQLAVEPGSRSALRHRVDLFTLLVESYSEPATRRRKFLL
ncbi:MAG TPA: TetR/AcrR family transcriptional regulator [Aeromicrobium sp.]|jgi:AcrR family transcriptional regulator|nr:TetR/AcrR family transcriptional regulator [Aeromicrobium sp.]HKY59319.1 TetR/AcrR family transcriptional regulator [Aeromicrobium sp.]